MKNLNKICGVCGGNVSLITCSCKYCGALSDNLQKEKESLINKINQIPFNEITNENMDYVILLRENEDEILKIDKIKDFYIQNNIHEKFDNILSDINNKLNSSLENTELEKQFLSKNILNNSKFQYNYEVILKQILLGNKLINEDAFKEIIRQEVTNILKTLYSNSKISKENAICEFKDMDDCNGFYRDYDKNITISNETLNKLYNSNIDGLFTLYHELYHSIQHFKIENSYNDFETIYDIKEFLLSQKLENYYQNNYDYVKTEKDANLFAYQSVKFSLKRLDLTLSENKLKSLEEENNLQLEQKENNIRKYNGEEVDFYDLFDKTIISNPEWLEKYPQLNIEYLLDNGMVRRKTKEEFVEYVMNNNIDPSFIGYFKNRLDESTDQIIKTN